MTCLCSVACMGALRYAVSDRIIADSLPYSTIVESVVYCAGILYVG